MSKNLKLRIEILEEKNPSENLQEKIAKRKLDEALEFINPETNPLTIEQLKAEIERCKALPDSHFGYSGKPEFGEYSKSEYDHFGAIFKKNTIEHLEYILHCRENPVKEKSEC